MAFSIQCNDYADFCRFLYGKVLYKTDFFEVTDAKIRRPTRLLGFPLYSSLFKLYLKVYLLQQRVKEISHWDVYLIENMG